MVVVVSVKSIVVVDSIIVIIVFPLCFLFAVRNAGFAVKAGLGSKWGVFVDF